MDDKRDGWYGILGGDRFTKAYAYQLKDKECDNCSVPFFFQQRPLFVDEETFKTYEDTTFPEREVARR